MWHVYVHEHACVSLLLSVHVANSKWHVGVMCRWRVRVACVSCMHARVRVCVCTSGMRVFRWHAACAICACGLWRVCERVRRLRVCESVSSSENAASVREGAWEGERVRGSECERGRACDENVRESDLKVRLGERLGEYV
jgi:hypothetical protein